MYKKRLVHVLYYAMETTNTHLSFFFFPLLFRLDIGGDELKRYLTDLVKFTHPHLAEEITHSQIEVKFYEAANEWTGSKCK